MKISSIFICLAVIAASAFSFATTENKKGLLVKVDFQFKNSKKSFQVKSDSILSEDNNNWTPLGPAQAGVALLGKVHKPDKGIFQVEYMVIDTSATPVALNQMSVISQLGKASSISSETANDKISVELIAEATTYTEKPKSK